MNRPILARVSRLAPSLGLVAALGGPALGQALEQEYVTPTLGTTTQMFGRGVSTKGDVMVVGSYGDDTNASNAGAAYVYRFNSTTASWVYEAQLMPSDPEATAYFGFQTAVDGDVAVVTAHYEDNAKGTDAGAAYVFRRNTSTGVWSQEQKLIPSVGAASDYFGQTVALVGNVLLVGAPSADTANGVDAGLVYVYRWKNSIVKWVEETTLVDPDGAASDFAGTGLAFDGTTAVVGCPNEDISSIWDCGAASVWSVSGTTWTHNQEIKATTTQYYAGFGSSVGVSGNEIVVGAKAYDATGSTDGGACYFFSKSGATWSQTGFFPNPDPVNYDYFGAAAAMSGKLAVVGSSADNAFARSDSGMAYTFRKGKGSTGWFLDQDLAASDGNVNDYFAVSLACSDEHIVLGASHNDTAAGTDWGVVYGFDAEEINLKITPTNPGPGGTINVSIYDGAENDPVLLVIDEVDGIPVWIEVVMYVFGADHRLTFDADVENPLLGMHIGATAWKVSPTGALVHSDRVYADV